MGVALGLMAIAAPFIGYVIATQAGWRWVFVFVATYAVRLAAALYLTIPHNSNRTLDKNAWSVHALWRVARAALGAPAFRGARAAVLLGYSGIPAHLAASAL
jgi:predicted MFS family arabinose efflux permease